MQSSNHAPGLAYRADIDGLRAAAVIAVVLYHAFPKLVPGGCVGVDTFFVISGYLITGIIVDGLDGPASFSFADFYIRRVRRIFPALILVLATTIAVGVTIFLQPELTSLAKNAIASAFFSANLMLLSEAGYFDLAAHLKPLLHLWSLGIEEQFYVVWPLALWLTPRKWRGTMIACVIAASFALNVALVRSHPQAAFYLPLTRGWELMLGASLVGVTIKGERLREAAGALGVVCGITFFTYSARMIFPGWAALVPVLGAGLMILGQGSFFSRTVLSHPIAAAIGRISYPLYLWHWPLLVFAQTYLFRPLTTAESLLAIAIATALAWLTYRFVERPIRSGQWGGAKTALAGMAGVAAAAVIALGTTPQLPKDILALIDVHPGSPEWQIGRCMLNEGSKDFAPDCAEQRRPLMALLGDSTAGALMPGLRDLQSRAPFGIAQFTVSSCQPLLTATAFGMTDSCLGRNREIVDLLAGARPDVVLLHAVWVVSGPDELRPLIAALRSIGVKHIIVLGRVPSWSGGLPAAIAAYYRRTRSLLPERTPLFVEQDDERMKDFSAAVGVDYISAREVFCNGDGCLARIDNELVASDVVHLTTTGSRYLIERIAPLLLASRSLSATEPAK
jgi:peptidoglycan/LPS O-acetylase OafA/YrhL